MKADPERDFIRLGEHFYIGFSMAMSLTRASSAPAGTRFLSTEARNGAGHPSGLDSLGTPDISVAALKLGV